MTQLLLTVWEERAHVKGQDLKILFWTWKYCNYYHKRRIWSQIKHNQGRRPSPI
jgi:hypothetical protein